MISPFFAPSVEPIVCPEEPKPGAPASLAAELLELAEPVWGEYE
jgi:hypothetical protein